ncbi:MAG: 4-alpha-glucanotransferase [Clostridiales Family XIII bacterium]|nr:4-alpha-glucanotransferase [Clostridiales Family XIII bacterium]
MLMPIFSLPSAEEIGTLGKSAFEFVDFLASAGQSLWQILPIGPTGDDNSPYRCLSAFAGNPLLIDLKSLQTDGLLSKEELETARNDAAHEPSSFVSPARVDYARVRAYKLPLLIKAASRIQDENKDYQRFCAKNAYWLDDFAEMQTQIKGEPSSAVEPFVYVKRIQYLFFSQWIVLKAYANAHGIGIIGDLPFYVSEQSADYRAHPELFLTVNRGQKKGTPSVSAGVPPDAFSANGQVWNVPVYAWHAHKKENYRWWLARLRQTAALYDLCRLDHFRGLSEYYTIPISHPASAGSWQRGPGRHFIDAVKKNVPGIGIIAEDLGILTDDLSELLNYSGFPGMKVLQFAFDPEEEDSGYLPHNHTRDSVVYTGTHDNNTLIGWTRDSKPDVVEYACEYLGVRNKKDLPKAMIRAAQASVADTAVIPVQDWLGLGEKSRINTPSTLSAGNWSFRLGEGVLTDTLADRVCEITKIYGRARD